MEYTKKKKIDMLMKVSHPGDAQMDILIGHEYLGVLVCKTFHSEPPVSHICTKNSLVVIYRK